MNAPVSGDVTLSVIVAAKDAETLIEDCLTSVLPQLRPGDDIVVIDDRSCDATAEICARLGVRLLLNSHAPGPYGARNLGAALATTTALVFFDTRCRALDGWLESHRDALRDADRPVISYSDIEVEQTPDIAAAIARHLNPFSVGTYARVGFYPACNLGVGRELFWQAGGFEEIRGGADAGLCFRATAMGAHFVVDPQTRVRWRPRATFRALQGQYRRYGTSKYRLRTDRVPLLVLDTAVFLRCAPWERSSASRRRGRRCARGSGPASSRPISSRRSCAPRSPTAHRRCGVGGHGTHAGPHTAEVEGFEPPVRVN